MNPALPPRVLAALAAGLDHASLACVDWNGRLRAKQLRLEEFGPAFTRGVAFTSAIFATDTAERPITTGRFQNPANGYPDAWLRADPQAVYGDAFGAHPHSLLVLGQLVDEHQAFCPRAILSREIAALGPLGFSIFGAFEYEFHWLRETTESLRDKTPAQLARLPELARMYSYVDQSLVAAPCAALRAAALASGVEIESLHAEFTGLLECALVPVEGMAIADRAVLFKAVAKTVARQHGLMAVFMARVAAEFESAGAHLNISLRTEAPHRAAFYAAESPQHLSLTLQHFVAGLQRYTPELALLHLPHINSYKRWIEPSFAPRVNAWGIENKTCAYRVVNAHPEVTRIEFRLPGADVNPHLCLAAVIAAGRRGIEQGLLPTPPVSGDAATSPHHGLAFPQSLSAALAAWRGSAFAQEIFGQAFTEEFAQTRDWQLQQLQHTVTDWELRQFAEGV